MKLTLSLFISLISPLFSLAQNTHLSGMVVDKETEDLIPGVTIVLLQGDTAITATETNLDGHFEIDKIERGNYHLVARCIGYLDCVTPKLALSPPLVQINIKMLPDPTDIPPIEVKWGHATFIDSLGNTYCVDLSKNQIDSAGLKQGLWTERFMNYADTLSGYRIGQKISEGEYVNDLKHGEWTYYLPNGAAARVEYYEEGVLKSVKPEEK